MAKVPRLKLLWLILTASITIDIILTTIFSLKNGIFDIFPYFYILPIILLAYIYPRFSIYFTVILGWVYLALVYFYGPFDIKLYTTSVAWFYIFVTLGVIISSYAQQLMQERKFRDIVTNSQAGIFTFDFETEIVKDINLKATQMLGFKQDELLNKSISKFWPDTDPRGQFFSRLLKEHQTSDSEVEFTRSDNSKIWVLATAALTNDLIVIFSIEDITDRKQAEAALKESEKKYRMIGELNPYGVWICDAHGSFTYLSDSFLDLLGLTLPECANWGWIQKIPHEDRERTLSDWKQCVQTRCTWDYEYRIIDKNGKERFILSRGSPLYGNAGNDLVWVGIHLDITERRRYENKLESSIKEKEVIIKEVHHRVKNNMQVISGFLLLQANFIEDPVLIEKLNECQQRVRTMALVHEKLYQSKDLGYIGAEEYIKSLVSDLLNSSTLTTIVDVKVNVDNVSVNLDIAIPCGLVINELLTNSLKHAFKDRQTGNITLDMHLGDDHKFRLTIQDDGVGLPLDFETRSAASLGMQLVHVLVRQLGGEIKVNSDNGARFEIIFPEKF
jgi:PAS domain S-box-containing protein